MSIASQQRDDMIGVLFWVVGIAVVAGFVGGIVGGLVVRMTWS